MEIGCYDLHLYCDSKPCPAREPHKVMIPIDYTGANRAEARRKAKKEGWLFTRKGRHFCTTCAKEKRK